MLCGYFAKICLLSLIPTAGTFRQLVAEEDVEGTDAAEGTSAVEEEGTAAVDDEGIASADEEGTAAAGSGGVCKRCKRHRTAEVETNNPSRVNCCKVKRKNVSFS